jgi:hypothetical protein
MLTTTEKQRVAKEKFCLNLIEREMLDELVIVLEMFEFVTDELQSNRVSISRVYPCISYLREKLSTDLNDYKYTKKLRLDLKSSIEKRFSHLLVKDLYRSFTNRKYFLFQLFLIQTLV